MLELRSPGTPEVVHMVVGHSWGSLAVIAVAMSS
jgi:hypothetical protein